MGDGSRLFFEREGPDYPWLKDNLEKSEAKRAAEITAAWTFSGQWVPESTTAPAVVSVARNADGIIVTFAEPVTVKGRPMLAFADGKKAGYRAGSGTATLTFLAVSPSAGAVIKLNGGAIVASQASAELRAVPDLLTLPAVR